MPPSSSSPSSSASSTVKTTAYEPLQIDEEGTIAAKGTAVPPTEKPACAARLCKVVMVLVLLVAVFGGVGAVLYERGILSLPNSAKGNSHHQGNNKSMAKGGKNGSTLKQHKPHISDHHDGKAGARPGHSGENESSFLGGKHSDGMEKIPHNHPGGN